jgi:hypothetical protein
MKTSDWKPQYKSFLRNLVDEKYSYIVFSTYKDITRNSKSYRLSLFRIEDEKKQTTTYDLAVFLKPTKSYRGQMVGYIDGCFEDINEYLMNEFNIDLKE